MPFPDTLVWEDDLQGDFGVNPIKLRRDLAMVFLALRKCSDCSATE